VTKFATEPPVLLESGAVLAAVKDAARRASARWPAAILDRRCARRPAGRQAGTKKRPPVSRTKKHDEVGSTGLPSKTVSLLPMMNGEEAKKRSPLHEMTLNALQSSAAGRIDSRLALPAWCSRG